MHGPVTPRPVHRPIVDRPISGPVVHGPPHWNVHVVIHIAQASHTWTWYAVVHRTVHSAMR